MLCVSEINAILTGYKHQNFSNHNFLHLEATSKDMEEMFRTVMEAISLLLRLA